MGPMGFSSLAMVVFMSMAYGTKGLIIREWRVYVPYYVPSRLQPYNPGANWTRWPPVFSPPAAGGVIGAQTQYVPFAPTQATGAPQQGAAQGVGGVGGETGLWNGYTMYQPSQYAALLEKLSAALQANGPGLTAKQIGAAGYKVVGSESHTGPGIVSLVNFDNNSGQNCYAYLVEPTGKTPEVPKESIACAG